MSKSLLKQYISTPYWIIEKFGKEPRLNIDYLVTSVIADLNKVFLKIKFGMGSKKAVPKIEKYLDDLFDNIQEIDTSDDISKDLCVALAQIVMSEDFFLLKKSSQQEKNLDKKNLKDSVIDSVLQKCHTMFNCMFINLNNVGFDTITGVRNNYVRDIFVSIVDIAMEENSKHGWQFINEMISQMPESVFGDRFLNVGKIIINSRPDLIKDYIIHCVGNSSDSDERLCQLSNTIFDNYTTFLENDNIGSESCCFKLSKQNKKSITINNNIKILSEYVNGIDSQNIDHKEKSEMMKFLLTVDDCYFLDPKNKISTSYEIHKKVMDSLSDIINESLDITLHPGIIKIITEYCGYYTPGSSPSSCSTVKESGNDLKQSLIQ